MRTRSVKLNIIDNDSGMTQSIALKLGLSMGTGHLPVDAFLCVLVETGVLTGV